MWRPENARPHLSPVEKTIVSSNIRRGDLSRTLYGPKWTLELAPFSWCGVGLLVSHATRPRQICSLIGMVARGPHSPVGPSRRCRELWFLVGSCNSRNVPVAISHNCHRNTNHKIGGGTRPRRLFLSRCSTRGTLKYCFSERRFYMCRC